MPLKEKHPRELLKTLSFNEVEALMELVKAEYERRINDNRSTFRIWFERMYGSTRD